MKYICHKEYNKVGVSGKHYLIKRNDELQCIGNFIAIGAEAVCSVTSEDAYQYFARNDDGNGMLRGKLTEEIAYAPRHPNRNNGFRFTEKEILMLEKYYKHFLRDDVVDTIIFNYNFFNANILELEGLKYRLEKDICI